MGGNEEKPYSVPLPSVTHHGFLYKTPSMAKPVGERKGQEGTWGTLGLGNRGARGWERSEVVPNTLPCSPQH